MAVLSLEDYSLMREVIAAIREGLPEADQLQPGQVISACARGAARHSPKNGWFKREPDIVGTNASRDRHKGLRTLLRYLANGL